tara:strand:+ start:202 stop:981 length:780 start_codon:yes stop_codon:yes gene_type:complete
MSYLESIFSLEGKTAVVIGGTGELCGAMAEGLAMAGAEIALVGRNEEKANNRIKSIEKAGGKAYFIQGDVTDKRSIQEILERVIKTSEKCEILVNGAGVNSATPFLEIPEEEFDQIFNTNSKSIFLTCQVFGKYFIDHKINASVINIGSMSGIIPLSRVFTYSMTKAAVHNISKNLAREWATQKIRVNTLVPGFFPAEQNRKVLTDDRIASIMGHTPMDRFGKSNELIGATLFLASEKASSFVTGTEIVVDGGYASMTI